MRLYKNRNHLIILVLLLLGLNYYFLNKSIFNFNTRYSVKLKNHDITSLTLNSTLFEFEEQSNKRSKITRKKSPLKSTLTEELLLSKNRTVDSHIPYKIFKVWDKPFPCFAPFNKHKAKYLARDGNLKGILYIKIPKTASSTLAGINIRIAHRHVVSSLNKKMKKCGGTFFHHRAVDLRVYNRSRNETFLWTMVRKPTPQFISQFFHFRVGRAKLYPNLQNLMDYHKRSFDVVSPPQMYWIAPKVLTMEDSKNEEKMKETVQAIIDEYDFMGVTERLDESLVALRLVLGLDAGDILYVSAKVNGGYDGGNWKKTCYKIPPAILSDNMTKYVYSKEWLDDNVFSTILHEAVNRSLDATIQSIGQDIFDKALEEHRYLMSLVNKICAPTAIFPCSKEGKRQVKKSKRNCYLNDLGCGYPCMDEVYLNATLNASLV